MKNRACGGGTLVDNPALVALDTAGFGEDQLDVLLLQPLGTGQSQLRHRSVLEVAGHGHPVVRSSGLFTDHSDGYGSLLAPTVQRTKGSKSDRCCHMHPAEPVFVLVV